MWCVTMPPSCSQCGSDSVVEDELYSQTQWVCQDCGSVVSEGTFTTILSDEQHATGQTPAVCLSPVCLFEKIKEEETDFLSFHVRRLVASLEYLPEKR